MRRWVIVVIAAAGCGRLGFDDPDGVVPVIGATYTWPSVALPDVDVDLSVTEVPDGVVIAWVPIAGGKLVGVKLATDGTLTGDPVGTTIKAGAWVTSSLGYINDTLVAAETAADLHGTKFDTIQLDLGGDYEFGCPPGATQVSKPPLFHAGTDLISPSTSDGGLAVWPFPGWSSELPAAIAVATPSTSGVTATSFGDAAVIVWSTSSGCFVEHVTDMATGVESQSDNPCPSPRIATDGASIVVVFEGTDGIYMLRSDLSGLAGAHPQRLDAGTSPRITYDGTRFWISYLAVDGAIVVGHLDGSRVVSTGIAAAPAHDAYELTTIRGQPWVVSATAAGLAADLPEVPGP